jgi:hypothetical protein
MARMGHERRELPVMGRRAPPPNHLRRLTVHVT